MLKKQSRPSGLSREKGGGCSSRWKRKPCHRLEDRRSHQQRGPRSIRGFVCHVQHLVLGQGFPGQPVGGRGRKGFEKFPMLTATNEGHQLIIRVLRQAGSLSTMSRRVPKVREGKPGGQTWYCFCPGPSLWAATWMHFAKYLQNFGSNTN